MLVLIGGYADSKSTVIGRLSFCRFRARLSVYIKEVLSMTKLNYTQALMTFVVEKRR